MQNSDYVERERIRGRKKYRRLNYGQKKLNNKVNSSIIKRLNVELRKRGYDMDGNETHHWNYNYPKQGLIVDRCLHKRIHNHLEFREDMQIFMFKGLLLDSFDKHIDAVKEISIIEKTELKYELFNIPF